MVDFCTDGKAKLGFIANLFCFLSAYIFMSKVKEKIQ
jgi:hypothetical protein